MATTILPTVDTTSLETVTGGAIRAAGGDTTAQLTQLTQLLSQLQSSNGQNGSCHNGGGFGGSMMMMMMMLAMRDRRPEPLVFVGPPRPWGC